MVFKANVRLMFSIAPYKAGGKKDAFDVALDNFRFAIGLLLRKIVTRLYTKIPNFITLGIVFDEVRTSAKFNPAVPKGQSKRLGHVQMIRFNNKWGKIYHYQDKGTEPSRGRYVPSMYGSEGKRRVTKGTKGGPVGEHPGIKPRHITDRLQHAVKTSDSLNMAGLLGIGKGKLFDPSDFKMVIKDTEKSYNFQANVTRAGELLQEEARALIGVELTRIIRKEMNKLNKGEIKVLED